MMRSRYRWILIGWLVCGILSGTTGNAAAGEAYVVSIAKLDKWADNERVVGFEVRIVSGAIHALPKVPAGWGIFIDNDASWNTSLKAEAGVGAAALDQGFFRDFVVVETAPHEEASFGMEMDITTTTDFENVKTKKLKMDDLEVRKD